MTATVNSFISGRNRDCFACRFISGCGLIGSGMYVSYQAKKFQNYTGKPAMYMISSVLVLLGAARILNLPPFRNQFSHG